jgi:glycerol-3-phosphate dehydrogenase
LDGTDFDLVVIGAGIHGAGVAQAAAARGHSVLVLERSGVASGTSSRSSKLIHGGLRYLETGQLGLVRECLRERKLLLRLAPDLVRLRPHIIPVYRETQRRPWQVRLGLALYATLGGLGSAVRFRAVARSDWGDLDGLRTDELQAVYAYWDAQTDDAALTHAVIGSALALGAELRVPAAFEGAVRDGPGWAITYAIEGRRHHCRSAALVNASGPWVNAVLEHIEPPPVRRSIELVQGTHIVLDGALRRGIYYAEAPHDGRVVFMMPWQGRVLAGTTETAFLGEPGATAPLAEERTYLAETVAHYFPTMAGAQILSAFAGLRVLPAGPRLPFGRAREALLHQESAADGRLLSIYGGKLTAYRATSERALRKLARVLPHRRPVADTRRLKLIPSGTGPLGDR